MSLIGANPSTPRSVFKTPCSSPGAPDQSVLLAASNRRRRGQMPPLSATGDDAAVAYFVNGSATCNQRGLRQKGSRLISKPVTRCPRTGQPDPWPQRLHQGWLRGAIGWTASAAVLTRTRATWPSDETGRGARVHPRTVAAPSRGIRFAAVQHERRGIAPWPVQDETDVWSWFRHRRTVAPARRSSSAAKLNVPTCHPARSTRWRNSRYRSSPV